MARFKMRSTRPSLLVALIAVSALLATAAGIEARQQSDSPPKTGIQRKTLGSGGARGAGRYTVFVPSSYDGTLAYPLILALPSAGSSDDAFMKGDDEVLAKLGEKHGYIIAVPRGSRSRRGMWTKATTGNAQGEARAEEANVLNVFSSVKEEYKIMEDSRMNPCQNADNKAMQSTALPLWKAVNPRPRLAVVFSPS